MYPHSVWGVDNFIEQKTSKGDLKQQLIQIESHTYPTVIEGSIENNIAI